MSPILSWVRELNEVRLRAEGGGFGPEVLVELLENVPVALGVTLGTDHRFVFTNRLFRTALATRTQNVIGRSAFDVLRDIYTPDARAARSSVLETGEPRELVAVPIPLDPDAEPHYWDIKLLPVRDPDDQVIGILTVAADATSRVEAQADADRQAHEAAVEHERLALALEATELGLWEWDAQTGHTFWSDRQKEIFGLPKDQPTTYEYWVSVLHPDDRDRVVQAVSSLFDPASGGQLRLEHRIVHPDGEIRWVLSRGRMLYSTSDGEVKPVRLLGTALDITDRRQAEETRQLLVRELNHRVKNLFAVASSMVTLTARTAATPKDMATTLRGRLDALARAHELIRPAIADNEPAAHETSVGDLVRAVLAPHVNQDLNQDLDRDLDQSGLHRLLIEGPPVPIGPNAATGLTLVFHELAANASKYGALSVPEGRVRIIWSRQGSDLTLLWEEENGPPIESAPAAEGFGSQLARKSVTGQLGGKIDYDWRREGLRVRIRLPLERLPH